jgi:hypothetical protein
MVKDRIEFKPMKQKSGGEVALSIYPPGKFINNKGYHVFVGGCGVGEKSTLEEAKELLLQKAISYCERRMDQAAEIIDEYSNHKIDILKNGLVQIKPKN